MTDKKCGNCKHLNVDEGGWACDKLADADVPYDMGVPVGDHQLELLPSWCPGWELLLKEVPPQVEVLPRLKRAMHTPPPYRFPDFLKALGFQPPPYSRPCLLLGYEAKDGKLFARISPKIYPGSILAIAAGQKDSDDLWDVPRLVPADEVTEDPT